MKQVMQYWLRIAAEAWSSTVAAQNWRRAQVLRRAVVFLFACAALYFAGELQPLQNKLGAVLLALGAAALVFVGEYLWHVVATPPRLAAMEAAQLAKYKTREASQQSVRVAVAALHEAFLKCVRLEEKVRKPPEMNKAFVLRREVEEWDANAQSLVDKYAPNESFGFASIAMLPHGRGIGDTVEFFREGRDWMSSFLAAKKDKLRRITMRIENPPASDAGERDGT